MPTKALPSFVLRGSPSETEAAGEASTDKDPKDFEGLLSATDYL